jgi:hypothetical protein
MSTYLVAFVVCDYHKKTMVTQNQISVSVYAPQHQLNRAEFALETATTLMDFFENFFNVSYSLPKQGTCAKNCLSVVLKQCLCLRSHRDSRLCGRRNGKLGPDHLSRILNPVRPPGDILSSTPMGGNRHRPRARTPGVYITITKFEKLKDGLCL